MKDNIKKNDNLNKAVSIVSRLNRGRNSLAQWDFNVAYVEHATKFLSSFNGRTKLSVI